MAKSKTKTPATVKPVACTVQEGSIQILFEGMKPLTFNRPKVSKEAEKDNPQVQAFDEILALVQKEDWKSVLESLRPNNDIGSIIKDDDAIEGLKIEKGRITYKGFTFKNSLTDVIIGKVADANRRQDKVSDLQELKPLVALLGRIVRNSDNRVVQSLYDYIDSNNVMVDEHGMLQTMYVSVDNDNKHKNHNLEGKNWDMPRNMVTSKNALTVFSGSQMRKPSKNRKVVRVTVDPADVVDVGLELTVCSLKVNESVQDDSWED